MTPQEKIEQAKKLLKEAEEEIVRIEGIQCQNNESWEDKLKKEYENCYYNKFKCEPQRENFLKYDRKHHYQTEEMGNIKLLNYEKNIINCNIFMLQFYLWTILCKRNL